MSFERVLLAFFAAFVLLAGVACLVAPANFALQAGLSATPSGLTEIRAFYGGLQIGFGSFLFWCLRDRALTVAGLLLEMVGVGALGIARVLGMLIDRSPTGYHLTNLAVEVTTVALIAVAFARRRRLAGRTA
ncbi:MAG TPA: DUF4345 domain-containing protein [Candidatus Binatia bacterium]|nr:DUF4345 domain-containing protein [Candidatus Binatia bacterium]